MKTHKQSFSTNKKIFDHFKTSDPILHEALLKVYAIHGDSMFAFKKSEQMFIDLCESIVSQQLSVKASDTIFNRFKKLFKKELPTPEQTIKLKDEDMRACGLSRGKVVYMKDLSQKIVDKQLDLESLDKLSNEEVIKELTKVKGIGVWTAEMFLMFGLGREDIYSHGDLALRNSLMKLYGLDKYELKVVEEIIAKWSPYKTYASRILWRSLRLDQ